ncbi:perlustrin-like protein [Mytilus edulis]|uniref:IGFBP N-terminal domain-containing protein n=1 Tax=Mytilus galloprovincialis TaxID=29158 RepID=A0A8B6F665_MYTGA|nr:Hypothetical predicted protein [Mytilus galloprovincialis]
MKTYTTIYVMILILFLLEDAKCHRCHNKCRHFLKHHPCPVLMDTNCEVVRRFCGCCDECALNLDEQCSAETPRCADGLMCVNSKGEALKIVHHSLKDYVGFCQNVVMSPVVVENTDITERKIRI